VSRQPHRRTSDITERLIGEIVAAKPASKTLKNREDIDSYLLRYFSAVPYEDMAGRSPKIMGQAALAHLEFAKARKPGQPELRIFNPTEKQHGYQSAYTIIEVVNDDMPFLVDSVSAAINRHGLAIHMTVHPIFRVKRDARGRLTSLEKPGSKSGNKESYIRFVVDREADQHHLDLLEHEISKVLADVRVAVRDWRKMRDKILEAASTLHRGPADTALRMESEALLQWLADDHFTLLGYREYELIERGGKQCLAAIKGSGLGVLSKDERGSPAVELTKAMVRHTRSKDPLIITKANSRATVHRHSYLDYIGVKVYDEQGNPAGERRFIGLFTSVAYSESPRNIPLLRLKVQRVLEQMELDPAGHRGKALTHILDSFPRDELFQGSVQDLVRTTDGVLNLQDRKRVKLFLRRDPFRRFFSCIVYIPREQYTTAVRHRVEEILLEEFGGIAADTSVQIVESPLARMHTIVRIGAGEQSKINIDQISNCRHGGLLAGQAARATDRQIRTGRGICAVSRVRREFSTRIRNRYDTENRVSRRKTNRRLTQEPT
jgi:glutamate dehydrogenase